MRYTADSKYDVAATLRHDSQKVVCSYNEWDPLEEIIVGSAVGACEMGFEPILGAYYGPGCPQRGFRGGRYSTADIDNAEEQLNFLVQLLQRHGVLVRRPEIIDHHKSFATPDFAAPCGNGHTCPRDVIIVVGDEIIEAPMAQRGRFFEYRAYRSLIKEYFRAGARWTTAPKPLMDDELYKSNNANEDECFECLTEHEPCFDAACFVRFGRDIFWQPDLVSNSLGFHWLRRHLSPMYRLHKIEFGYVHIRHHIDTTLIPIRPGLVLVNPEHRCEDGSLELFRKNGWQVVEAPPPAREELPSDCNVSNWIALNILSLDPTKVVVEEAEEPLMKCLESYGCQVVPCPFHHVYKFGGGFHCCTVDVRRRGRLESYFPTFDE